ncbi:zinc ribbon domain-containing protein [Geitlerinema splendidum]|nr:zinc ribbon domain-containing protein [Geitlerinema splendidum]
MPTYVYECNKCESISEVEQRISEDPLTDCACGAKGSLKRLIQPTAVMFKGSGFYVNDSVQMEKPASKPETSSTSCDATGACPACPTASE